MFICKALLLPNLQFYSQEFIYKLITHNPPQSPQPPQPSYRPQPPPYTPAVSPSKCLPKTPQITPSIDDLMALDKNGDGSIVEELKELLTNKDFIKTCEFKIQREKNHESNNNLINSIDKKDKNNESDEKITEDEMLAAFGQNEIADLFKMSDGSVDKALMLVLGGVKQKDGTYTISVNILKNRIYLMDKDRDGKITKEEVEIFKNSDYYKEMLNIHG